VSPEHKRLVDGGAQGESEQGAAELLQRSGPVPQNDDLARERVWRSLQKSLPGAKKREVRWVWPALAVGAVAALLLVVFAVNRAGEVPYARIELTAGPVFTAMPEHAWASAQAGTELHAASRVKTDAASRTLLRLQRSALLVSQSTDLGLESLGKDTFVRLTGGEVLAEVEHRQPSETFVIQTTRYKVTVRGTVLSVHERAADDVTVSVSRGLVEVTGEGGTWQVPAGKSWHSLATDALGADEITANDRALVGSVANDAPRAMIRIEGTAGVQVSEGGMVLGPAPVTWAAPAGQYHFSGAGEQGASEVDATTDVDRLTTVKLQPAPTPPTSPTLPATPSPETGEGARRADEGDVPQAVVETIPPPAAHPTPSRHHTHHASSPHHETASAPASERPSHVRASEPVATRPTPPPAPEQPAEAAPPPVRPVAGPTPVAAPTPVARSEDTPPIAEPTPVAAPHPSGTATGVDRPAPPPAPPSDPYTDALKLEHDKSYAEAALLLEKVANEHGPRSGAALYELGRIQQLNLGQPAFALATFGRYEREYPKGILIQEAELSVIELELQQKSYDAALENMNAFLSNHSKSERASEVHLERAELYRERGDCSKALDDYAKAKAPGQLDDSLYFSAWCEQKLGDRDAAEKSFGAYLDRFPSGRHAAQARAALGEK